MRARVKMLYSPDIVPDLEKWKPESPDFGFLIEADIGPVGEEGTNIFQFMVCTPQWFADHLMTGPITSGRHTLFVKNYDHDLHKRYIEQAVESCEADDWGSLAQQLQVLGAWEFHNYRA